MINFETLLAICAAAVALTIILKMLFAKPACEHDWHCAKPHRSHDISDNLYTCRRCEKENRRIE